ncbi:hypothetical protein Ancab_006999 [Ancistrocladus abbreviatus]
MSVAAGSGTALQCCPVALATHEEVVNQPELFWHTLRSFHSLLATKFVVPVIGKKELDLYLLYVEVSKRGGFNKVIMEKKWREIGYALNFSPTITSASYVLKKHYGALLQHYEQVYFFRSKGPLFAPTASPLLARNVHGADIANNGNCSWKIPGDSPDSPVGGSLGSLAIGTIDGKFDCGYMVSVKLGSDILYGVLYHPEEQLASPTRVADLSTAIVPYSPKSGRSRRQKKRRRWGRDPSYPKPNRSGYNFFFAEKHSALKSLYPNREREFTKMIGESWNKLSPEERMFYQNIGLRDKERYKRELKEYREKLKERLEASDTSRSNF